MEWLGYLASICIGLVLGILGGGGSILTIPILVYLFQINAVTASAYSLFIVGVTSLVGVIPKHRDHLVDLRTSLYFGFPSIVTIFITRKWIIPSIPDVVVALNPDIFVTKRVLILGIFSVLMILASLSMLLNRKPNTSETKVYFSSLLIFEGLLIGFLTGLVGAGGGFLIIPALVLVTGLKFKTAVGTSLLIIGVNSLIGFVGDVLNYEMDWMLLLSLTLLAVLGIIVGAGVSRKMQAEKLRRAFACFVLVAGSWMLFNELYHIL
jgi:uncharacterized membrane protein YfcA